MNAFGGSLTVVLKGGTIGSSLNKKPGEGVVIRFVYGRGYTIGSDDQ
jgi:hypothetical protein